MTPEHGDNKGPKDADQYADEVAALYKRAEEWRDIEINDKNSEMLREDIAKAATLKKKADGDRKTLTEPFLAGQRRINDEFRPILSTIEVAESAMKKIATDFLRRAREKQEAEARAKREAEEKARREAEILKDDPLLGRQAQEEALKADIEAKRAERQRPLMAAPGTRALGLRTTRKAKVIDAKAMVMHFAHFPSVIAEAEKLANAQIKAARGGPVEIPGVEVDEVQSV